MNSVPAVALAAFAVLPLAGCGLGASDAGAQENERVYRLAYVVTVDPAARGAHVELRLEQRDDYLRELDMSLLGGRISDVEGDGDVSVGEDRARWLPPDDGGRLRWFASLEHLRDDDEYDAYVSPEWALFRGEDIIPSANTRTLRGSLSDTRLELRVPDGWSSVTPYFGSDHRFAVDNPERRFDTPTGWIVLGELGVRTDRVSGIRTKVAGPVGHGIRRMDMLALLRWTLPELLDVLPEFPQRLTIVSAGDPMWRGALSGPQSLFVHAGRPLISENGTSTLLHEVVHVGLGISAGRGADWIVEGLSEYYSLEALRRSGTISPQRFARAHDHLEAWGRKTSTLCAASSNGSRTARAVTILARVDEEIKAHTDGRANLDEVLDELARMDGKVTVARFREIVAGVAGAPVEALEPGRLPGCDGTD